MKTIFHYLEWINKGFILIFLGSSTDSVNPQFYKLWTFPSSCLRRSAGAARSLSHRAILPMEYSGLPVKQPTRQLEYAVLFPCISSIPSSRCRTRETFFCLWKIILILENFYSYLWLPLLSRSSTRVGWRDTYSYVLKHLDKGSFKFLINAVPNLDRAF